MASIRNLKKDVDFLIDEVIWDCILYTQFNKSKNIDEVEKILTQAVDLRNGLYDRINHPAIESPKQTKAYYKNIMKDLLTGMDGLFQQISKLAKG